jgi:hypothetical protein
MTAIDWGVSAEAVAESSWKKATRLASRDAVTPYEPPAMIRVEVKKNRQGQRRNQA